MPIDFRDPIRAAWIKGCRFPLGRFSHLAEHFTAAGLIEADRRIDQTNGLEHAGHAQGGELAREDRLLETGGHETLRREIVHFMRPCFLHQIDNRQLIQKIGGSMYQQPGASPTPEAGPEAGPTPGGQNGPANDGQGGKGPGGEDVVDGEFKNV